MILKAFGLSLALACSLAAQEFTLATLADGNSVVHYDFQVQPETGRVRIALHYLWPDVLEEPMDTLRDLPISAPPSVLISALFYDDTTGEISYTAQGRRVVCARSVHRRFLWKHWRSITPTSACPLEQRKNQRSVDTGWEIRSATLNDVFLRIP